MSGKTTRAQERRADLRFSIVGPLLAAPAEDELRTELERLAPTQWRLQAVTPRLWIILDAHTRMVRYVQCCFGETAEDRVHELYQAFLKRGLPTPLLTDKSLAMRAGRKGSDGDVQ